MQKNRNTLSRTVLVSLIFIIITLIFTLFFAEIVLRFYHYGRFSIVKNNNSSRIKLNRYDEELGWTNIPNFEGYLSDPKEGFNGFVKFDENGIRVNDNDFNAEGEAILMVGGSVTGGFEVDNNETYSAVLERLFFENGCNYRVYNAGVNGYGTDQSLWLLERLLNIVKPKYVIYMFSSDDFVDNRSIKISNTLWGKPAFAFSNEELILVNRPSKKFEISYYAYIKYTDDGYDITQGYINETQLSIRTFIKNNFALYYPLRNIYTYFKISPENRMEKEVRHEDFQVLELILKSMKKDGIELLVTSKTDKSDEEYIDDLIRISDKLKIMYLNILPYFPEDPANYRWKNDGHWNEKGHLQAATALYELLKPRLCNKETDISLTQE
ncbi:MAG: hypothetical protein RIG61_07580 [Deltaproteobacteria bacterium]